MLFLQIDLLGDENQSLLDKLRRLEEKLQESEMRSRELEKQVVVCTSSSNTIFTWRTFEFCLPVLFQYIPFSVIC
jgi:hypothetical protein